MDGGGRDRGLSRRHRDLVQAVCANTREATEDLGALEGEVDASLRKVNRLVEEINRKWPFARSSQEIKLP